MGLAGAAQPSGIRQAVGQWRAGRQIIASVFSYGPRCPGEGVVHVLVPPTRDDSFRLPTNSRMKVAFRTMRWSSHPASSPGAKHRRGHGPDLEHQRRADRISGSGGVFGGHCSLAEAEPTSHRTAALPTGGCGAFSECSAVRWRPRLWQDRGGCPARRLSRSRRSSLATRLPGLRGHRSPSTPPGRRCPLSIGRDVCPIVLGFESSQPNLAAQCTGQACFPGAPARVQPGHGHPLAVTSTFCHYRRQTGSAQASYRGQLFGNVTGRMPLIRRKAGLRGPRRHSEPAPGPGGRSAVIRPSLRPGRAPAPRFQAKTCPTPKMSIFRHIHEGETKLLDDWDYAPT